MPVTVSARQFRRALIQLNLLDPVNTLLASAPKSAQVDWEFGTQVERNWPLIGQFAQALGKSESEVDDVFRLAATF